MSLNSREVEKKRIILHCGAPKTGSTTLQFFFADHKNALAIDGVFCPPRALRQGNVDPLHRLLVALRDPKKADQALTDARARLRVIFEETEASTVLLSNESMLGEPFDRGMGDFFPDHEFALDQLKKLFDGYEICVVFFIRDFVSFLPSYYVQHVRRGSYWSFGRFCGSIDIESLNWWSIVARLKSTFGQENVTVFEQATLAKSGPQTFKAAFGRFLPNMPLFEVSHTRNTSVGGLAVTLYRIVNWLVARLVPENSRSAFQYAVRKRLFGALGRIGRGRKVKLPDELVDSLNKRYEADRDALGV